MMMRSTVLATLTLLLVSTTSHARFTQSDTWMGLDQQPITLNKYAYANNDPINMVDPSGYFANLGGVSTAISAQTQLANLAAAGVGINLLLRPPRLDATAFSNQERGWGLWDVIASAEFEAKALQSNAEIRQANSQARGIAVAANTQGEPPHGHHTVPIFLCGRLTQNLAYLEAPRHRVLHSQLAVVSIARTAAEAKANQTLPSIGRNRNSSVLRMADTKAGRTKIANTLERFYRGKNWWSQGYPTIGTVFPNEKRLYITSRKNTSIDQGCSR